MPNISSSPLLPFNVQLVLNEVIKTSRTRSHLLIFSGEEVPYFKKILFNKRAFFLFLRGLSKIVVLVVKNMSYPEEGLDSQVHILKLQYYNITK